jgi:hypothetical protein
MTYLKTLQGSGGGGMSLFISSVFTYDEDAGNYIQAVETADAQALEPATRKAINNFVIGCKQDGIWDGDQGELHPCWR